MVRQAFAKGKIHSWKGHRIECEDLRGEGQKSNKRTTERGRTPLPFTGRTEQEKLENVLAHQKAVGHNGGDLVLEPDGPTLKPHLFLYWLCDPEPAFNLSGPQC